MVQYRAYSIEQTASHRARNVDGDDFDIFGILTVIKIGGSGKVGVARSTYGKIYIWQDPTDQL